MGTYHWIHPEFRDLVAQHRLNDLQQTLARRDGQPIPPGHRSRDTIRLDLPTTGGGTQTLFLKREFRVRWKHVVRHYLAGRGWCTPARAELQVLNHLASHGIPCPRVAACLQQIGRRCQGCLLVESLPECPTLSGYLASQLRIETASRREAFFTQLGWQLARLHGSGVHQPRLYSDHIFVDAPSDDSLKFWFLGFRHARVLPRLNLRKRACDVAALMATLPKRLAGDHDREALYDAYLKYAEMEDRGMEFLAEVSRHVEQLLTHRKIWEVRESDTDEHRSVRPLESVQTGKMWIDRGFRSGLEHAGIANFEAMMETTNGRQLRALADRENWRLELHGPQPELRGAYLKKHHVRRTGTWIRSTLR